MTLLTEDAKRSELEMTPEQMLELAHLAAELVVEWIDGLAEEPAWRGGSSDELEPIMWEALPGEVRPPAAVIECTAREILPLAGRVDHPRFFAFEPSSPTWPGVLADFTAAGYNVFQGTWLGASGPSQLEVVVIDWFKEWLGYPESAGGLFTSGGGVGGQPRRLRGGAGGCRSTRRRDGLHERSEPHGAQSGSHDRGRASRVREKGHKRWAIPPGRGRADPDGRRGSGCEARPDRRVRQRGRDEHGCGRPPWTPWRTSARRRVSGPTSMRRTVASRS